jgi:hypothetical protein
MAKTIKETPILTSKDAVNFYKQKVVDEKFKKKKPENNLINPPGIEYQPLFDLMSGHGLILIQSEMDEIISCVKEILYPNHQTPK